MILFGLFIALALARDQKAVILCDNPVLIRRYGDLCGELKSAADLETYQKSQGLIMAKGLL